MSNVFQDISPHDHLPQEVRQQTLSNLYTLRLVLDVMDLFVVKAGNTMGEVMGQTLPAQAPNHSNPSANPLSDSQA